MSLAPVSVHENSRFIFLGLVKARSYKRANTTHEDITITSPLPQKKRRLKTFWAPHKPINERFTVLVDNLQAREKRSHGRGKAGQDKTRKNQKSKSQRITASAFKILAQSSPITASTGRRESFRRVHIHIAIQFLTFLLRLIDRIRASYPTRSH